MPTRFSFDQYARNPSYPAVLEARLTTTPIPAADRYNLAQYAEPTFPGYARKSPANGTLSHATIVGTASSNLDFRGLAWTAQGGFPIVPTACLIVATFPGESPQLVGIVPITGTLNEAYPTVCVTASFQTDRVVL